MSEKVELKPCPFCGGTEFVEGYQGGYGALASKEGAWLGASLYHVICRDCGSILRVPAATDEDLDRLCCHYTLTIKGNN